MEPRNKNTIEKIYAILDSITLDKYGCKNWPTKNLGYPVSVSIGMKRRKVCRIVLERKLGRPIKPGYCALHTCDWASCVNEDHLYEGTKKDNAQDRVERYPESYDHLRQDNPLRRERAQAWQESPEGKAHWKRVQPMGRAKWKKDTITKK